MLPAYDQLGQFYLGRRYDPGSSTRLPDLVLYDSRDLVTHAVCIGMTGSGKTGLGIGIIEEAALDRVPVLAIDPKGDLTNLLLTFPNLEPADFAPWVEERQPQSEQLNRAALAERMAARWRAGLAEWDQDGARIARFRSAAEVRVYTPGSRTGIPLAVLGPPGRAPGDPEDAAARTTTVAASLLALAGVADAGPHSRDQALVAAILSQATEGRLDLARLVQQIVRPSFDQVGVMDLESFYPARDRQQLALRFNSVLATPGFDVWASGEPLDVGSMLFAPDGRPRIAIVSVAHLDEAQRMTAVALVLNAALEWTRRQGGSSSLRALLYMDEVFGYLPPVANPPSKLPLLTMLKQARASGVGVMLATQNPVDLDYKALSNTGTWFLGKLQTERDKARVLDGLEGLTSSLTRGQLDQLLSGLRSRVFLMHNVHEAEPVVFETRWTMSYLRGPLTRDELRAVLAASPPAAVERSSEPPGPSRGTSPGSRPSVEPPESQRPAPTGQAERPVLPPGISEYFLPPGSGIRDPGGSLPSPIYEPMIYGSARVHYSDARRGVDTAAILHAIVPIGEGAAPVVWDKAEDVPHAPADLVADAPASIRFRELPAPARSAGNYGNWADDFRQWILRARPLALFEAPAFKLTSRPGESRAEFAARVQQTARERRDAAVDKLRTRYAPKVARAADKLRRAQEALNREEQQVSHQKMQTAVSFGATLLGALMGRKAVSTTTLGRATTAARGVGRSMKEVQDVAQARERQEQAERDLREIHDELEREVQSLQDAAPEIGIDTIEVKAKRTGVDVQLVALVWRGVSE